MVLDCKRWKPSLTWFKERREFIVSHNGEVGVASGTTGSRDPKDVVRTISPSFSPSMSLPRCSLGWTHRLVSHSTWPPLPNAVLATPVARECLFPTIFNTNMWNCLGTKSINGAWQWIPYSNWPDLVTCSSGVMWIGDGQHSPSHMDLEKGEIKVLLSKEREMGSGQSRTTILPEHRFFFLEQWKYSEWYCNNRCMSLYVCPNPENVQQHQEP